MAKVRSKEDVKRILRAKSRFDHIVVGKKVEMVAPLKIVEYGGGFCVALDNGKFYSVKDKPVVLTKAHAEWFSYRLRPESPAASFRAIGPNCAFPTDKDILNANVPVTDDIYVVSPGPNGKEHYDKIDNDAFIIVTNKAIEIPLKADLWISCEPGVKLTEWFNNAVEDNKHIGCFWSHYLYKDYPDIPYTYEFGPPLRPDSAECIPSVLRSRATISAQAVQLAYLLGAKRIIMCGIDIMGNKYFDATCAGENRPEKNWRWVLPLFNPMIEWIEAQGVKVVTLSETALDVEVV